MIDAQQILRRYDRLVAAQQTYRILWQNLADFIQPRKSSITVQRAPGQKQTERLYDTTAIHANELLAASLHGALTPSGSKWFSFEMRDEALNENQQVKEWLEDSAQRMYMALNQSNFSQEIDEVYLDMGCFGTGAVFVDEKEPRKDGGFGGFRFTAIPFGRFYVDENADGRVDVLFRNFSMSPRAAVGKWGDAVGDSVKAKSDKGDAAPVEIIQAVYPQQWTNTTTGEKFPYYSAYVMRIGAIMLEEGGFRGFPFMVPRWRKSAGEIYGRGPGHTSLADIKSLNKAKELDLRAWAKVVDPPMASLDGGVIGSVRLYPGAINIVKSPTGDVRTALMPLQLGIDFKANAMKSEELRQSIRQIFFTDQLEPLGSVDDRPDMTATEATIRNELMLRLLGPTAGRLESELLGPMIEYCFEIMFNAGRDPMNPKSAGAFMDLPDAIVQGANGGPADIDVKYLGMLARAQQSGDVTAIQRLLQFVQAIAAANPAVLDLLDDDKMVHHLADIIGVPADLFKDQEVVDQTRQQRAVAQHQQQQMQEIAGAAQAGGQVAPLIDSVGKIAANGAGNGAPTQ